MTDEEINAKIAAAAEQAAKTLQPLTNEQAKAKLEKMLTDKAAALRSENK